MPIIKTLREDILRKSEIDSMLERAKTSMERALIAVLWLFGKRISEVLKIRRQDTWIESGYLYVRFVVLKKPNRKEHPTEKYYLKRIKADHPYVQHISDYAKSLNPPDLLFPFSRTKAWRLLKKINPNVYPHFFRESLATHMAEKGGTEFELMHWFDWDRYDTAAKYVKRGTKLIEKWSDREF